MFRQPKERSTTVLFERPMFLRFGDRSRVAVPDSARGVSHIPVLASVTRPAVRLNIEIFACDRNESFSSRLVICIHGVHPIGLEPMRRGV